MQSLLRYNKESSSSSHSDSEMSDKTKNMAATAQNPTTENDQEMKVSLIGSS